MLKLLFFPKSEKKKSLTSSIFLQFTSNRYIGLAKELSNSAALFLLDLLCVFDRGLTMRLFSIFMEAIVPAKCSSSQRQLLESCKMDALSVVCSHEHFVGLNAHGHILASILIRTVLDQQKSMDKAVRLLAMSALRNQLLKLAFDSRYQSSKLRGRVSALFFSFVVILVKERDQFWDRYNLEEKRTALFCFLYIISTSSSSLLLQWWSQSDLASLESFFGLLCRALLTFEYRGRAHVISMARDFTSMKREWNKKKNFFLLIC